MIEMRVGNVLDIPTGIIVHGCNCRGVMGGGIALAIKKRYPIAFERYKDDEATCGLCPGNYSYVEVEPMKFIVNAYTQDDFGTHVRQVNYEAIARCFEKIVKLATDLNAIEKTVKLAWNAKLPEHQHVAFEPITVIAFPMIGAGLAGGNWRIIEKIIDETIPDASSFKKVLYVLPT